jgi:hypothetical protein
MQYIPFSMIKSIHEQTHSATPTAPLRPYRPRRHPFRAVRTLFHHNIPTPAEAPVTQPAQEPVALALVSPMVVTDGPIGELCEAEVRDRGTTPAGVARPG